MRPAATAIALALCLAVGFAAGTGSPAPLTVWGSGSFLSGGSSDKAVPAMAALEELFSGMVSPSEPSKLAGLLDGSKLKEQRPEAVVVLASAALPAQQSAAAVQEKLAALASAAPNSLQLPNAEHAGTTHPVFAALRRSARAMRVRVLGDCGGSYVPAALPPTADALRRVLAAPLPAGEPAGRTRVVVMCLPPPPAGEEAAAAAAEAALLDEVNSVAAAAVPGSHLLVHTLRPATPGEESARRRLLAGDSSGVEEQVQASLHAAGAGAAGLRADRANQTGNYTTCDPLCQKHVMWMEGLIILVVVAMALAVGVCCMHLVDVPTRFAQPETARREHAD